MYVELSEECTPRSALHFHHPLKLAGIPADFEGSYVIKQGGQEVVASAPLTGSTISATLAPGGRYEIELAVFYGGGTTGLVCSTVALDLVPTCSEFCALAFSLCLLFATMKSWGRNDSLNIHGMYVCHINNSGLWRVLTASF